MTAYDLQALITRFDQNSEGEIVGALSSLMGESLLVDLLADALRRRGSTVHRQPGRPIRDDNAFDGMEDPGFRDLDAWLVVDETTPVAVECKHLTSCSRPCRTVGADVATYALKMWRWLEREHLHHGYWTDTNKVALPVRAPAGWTGSLSNLRRILAIWTPISRTGDSVFSTATTSAPIGGVYQAIPIEVFSGSLYARGLLAEGQRYVGATVSRIADTLDALNTLFGHTNDDERRRDLTHTAVAGQ